MREALSIVLKKTKQGIGYTVPKGVMALVNTWTDRIQEETGVPVGVEHTISAYVEAAIKMRAHVQGMKEVVSVDMEYMYERVKAGAVRVCQLLVPIPNDTWEESEGP